MIQFNLLPDVKLEYLKTERLKRMVMAGALGLSVLALAIFAFLIVTVDVLQKTDIRHLDSDIKKDSQKLQAIPNLTKILTVQNQLNALAGLHDNKPATTRLFTYVSQLTPQKVTISSLNIDFSANTMNLTGLADNLDTVNTFTDTLKFTTYQTKDQKKDTKPFTSVVLASFSRDDKGAHYTISVTFDHVIFSNTEDVKLTVPQKTTTRSTVEQPNVLFKADTNGVKN